MTDSVDRDRGRGQPRGEGHLDDELLSRLVDGDLPPDEQRVADVHMATCPACHESLDALRSTVALLQALPAPRPARSFQLGPAHARRPSGWRRLSGWLTPSMPAMRAAVVALVLLVGGVAAFGALRDDPDFTGSSSNDAQTEPTVADTDGPDGVGETTLLATIEAPPLEQAEATTLPPTATADVSTGRSAPAAGAAGPRTATAGPETVADEIAPAPAAPNPAATVAPVPTATRERESIVAIEGETAEDAGADDAADGAAGDTAAESATAPPETEGPIAEAELAEEESADVPADEDAADAPEDGGDPAGDAPNTSAAQDTMASESAPEAEPTSTATPSPTPTHQPTNMPATPMASPVASPIASPVASLVASPSADSTGMPSLDLAISSDRMRPHRLDAVLVLAISLALGVVAIAARASRRSAA